MPPVDGALTLGRELVWGDGVEGAIGCVSFILARQGQWLVAEPERVLLLYLSLGGSIIATDSIGVDHVNTVGVQYRAKLQKRGVDCLVEFIFPSYKWINPERYIHLSEDTQLRAYHPTAHPLLCRAAGRPVW